MTFSLGRNGEDTYLDGHLLIAMPSMEDQRFQRSVIYVCAHSPEGAMGIVVNQRARKIKFPELLVQLEVIREQDAIMLPPSIGGVQVLRGGPVETGRGFVLHSADYTAENSTLAITDDVCLTATVDILRAMAQGEGPASAVLALGYAAWSPGQLESEILANGWLYCPADPSFIFDSELEGKYARAIRKFGIEPAMLSSQTGHA